MKVLGLIGGLSWYSTSVYYKTINQLVNQRLGGSHSAKLLLYSVDFNEFKVLQENDEWEKIRIMLSEIAIKLEKSGAECIVMCTNTPHLVADQVRKDITIPLLHIAEETAKEINTRNITTVGLIGTKFTMENSFFRDRLTMFGINTVIPGESDRNFIHNSIFNELTKGLFKPETLANYITVIEKLAMQGAQGIIFGCTEITLLINEKDSPLPVFDTSLIHS